MKKKIEQEVLIEKVIQKCFEVELINPTSLYICVTLTTPNNIRETNKQYRNIDKETDVLSFPMYEKEEISSLKLEHEDILGDMVISIEKVKEQAVIKDTKLPGVI